MIIDDKSCIACGQCVEACPTSAISYNREKTGYKTATIDDFICIDCGQCKEICPGDAIREGER